jgi:hypothetical protein
MSWEWKVENGDIVRTAQNTGYVRVEGKDKLKQDVTNILQTAVRADTGLGTSLGTALGAHVAGEPDLAYGTPAMFKFQRLLTSGVNKFRVAQRKYLFSRRTPDELLDDFSPLQVSGTDDPRVFRWRIDFYTMGNLPNFALGGQVR